MFIANVRAATPAIAERGVTIHHPCCRYASLSRRWYRIDAAEVLRRHSRIRNGDGGSTRMCALCRPDRMAGMAVDPT